MDVQPLPEYTEEQVAAHCTEQDCWVIVGGAVLDVTQYLPKHPGGKQLILRSAGLDCTRDFAAMFHSVRARARLPELTVGRVAGTHRASSTLQPPLGAPPRNIRPVRPGSSPSIVPVPLPGAARASGPYGLSTSAGGLPAITVQPAPDNALTPRDFCALRVVSRTPVAADCCVLRVALPSGRPAALTACQHLRLRWGEHMRSYTPVAWNSDWFELLVKQYPEPGGAMSRHLCSLQPGDCVEVRGPVASGFDLAKHCATHASGADAPLVLLSMGTGVTPMVQLLNAIWVQEWGRGLTRPVYLYHCSHSAADVLCQRQLVELRAVSCGNLHVQHWYSAESSGRLTPELLLDSLHELAVPLQRCTVCICGTDNFVLQFRTALKPLAEAVYGM